MPKHRFVVGVDESGKGDFFGPLVVAAFGCDDDQLERLKELGVRDGKLIADKKLLTIADQLRAHFPHTISIVTPEEYNRRYDKIRNLNKLLAEEHASVIASLAKSCQVDLTVSDKFGKSELIENALARLSVDLPLKQIHRGEQIGQVAAASILARAGFLEWMASTSDRIEFELPRGASAQVDRAGRELVGLHGPKVLKELSKLHFKNYQRVINPTLFA